MSYPVHYLKNNSPFISTDFCRLFFQTINMEMEAIFRTIGTQNILKLPFQL